MLKETSSDDKGATTIKLANGAVINLVDYIHTSYRSAFVVGLHTAQDFRETLFTNVRSQPIPGHPTGAVSSRTHCNLPRSGDNGLPKDWQMLVEKWYAVINVPLAESVMEFASHMFMDFIYNGKTYGDATLLELLLGKVSLAGEVLAGGGMTPVMMRENLGFHVNVRMESEVGIKAIQSYLMESAKPQIGLEEPVAQLQSIARILEAKDASLASEVRRVCQTLIPSKLITCWVHLEGYAKRPVV